MANEKNLKPVRTTNEAKKRGSNGGKASVVARRKKRDMKAQMKLLLEMGIDKQDKVRLKKLGLDEDDMTKQTLMLLAQMQEAINGNTNAAKFVATISGNMSMTEHEKERISIEKEKLRLERERIEAFKEKGLQIAPGGMPIMIVDDVPEDEDE